MSNKIPYSYVISCLADPLLNLMCMNELIDYYTRKEDPKKTDNTLADMPKIVLRMDDSYGFDGLTARYPMVSVMPNDGNVISMDYIQHRELDEVSRLIHAEDPANKNDEYNCHKYEARIYRLLHYEVKLEMARQMFRVGQQLSQKEREQEKKRCKTLLEYMEKMDRDHKGDFVDIVEKTPDLFVFGAIEHRRWAYHKLLSGYTYDTVKDDVKCTNPDLLTYGELIHNSKLRNDVFYDYKDWKIVLREIMNEFENKLQK